MTDWKQQTGVKCAKWYFYFLFMNFVLVDSIDFWFIIKYDVTKCQFSLAKIISLISKISAIYDLLSNQKCPFHLEKLTKEIQTGQRCCTCTFDTLHPLLKLSFSFWFLFPLTLNADQTRANFMSILLKINLEQVPGFVSSQNIQKWLLFLTLAFGITLTFTLT